MPDGRDAIQIEIPAGALPPGPALLHDAAGIVVAAADELACLLGFLVADELVGRHVAEIVVPHETPDDAPGALPAGRARRAGGDPLPVRIVAWPRIPGLPYGAIVLVRDAPARPVETPADPAVPMGSRRLADVERIAGLGCWEVDLADGSTTVSPELRAMLGLHPQRALTADDLLVALPAEDRTRLASRWHALLDDGEPFDVEVRPRRATGRLLHMRAGRVADRGTAGLIIGTVEDVTDRRRVEKRLRTTHQRFTDLLAIAPVGIALFDDDERLVKANQALCRLLGQGPEALRGRRADQLLDLAAEIPGGSGPATPLLARPAGSAGSVSWSCPPRALRTWERGARGAVAEPVWCELHVSVSVHDDGSVTHLVVFTDVTATRRVEASLRHLAMHDELTGLPNRRALTTTVSRLLTGPTARRTAVLFCDLDNFKRVNDSLGHDAGDELLLDLAALLRAKLPAGCAASRISGDEFVVVCADVDVHGGLDELSGTVASILRTAVPVHGQLVRVSATVGAAVGATVGVAAGEPHPDGDIDPYQDPVAQVLGLERSAELAGIAGGPDHPGTGDLLRFADAALFEAKSGGNGRFALADEAIMRGADEALRMETQLREAMINDELVLHFQPVVGADGEILTAEALVRWQHPEHGLLYPDKFLPIAEAADLMGDLDRWVLRTAVREAARWPVVGDRAPSVAVNLAGLLPGDPDFLPTVHDAVAEAGLRWDRLILELVETCLADLPPYTLREMNELIAAGVRFAVDDFGTGYSSLSRLTGLPAQIVKLDRGFVRGVAVRESDRAVARAVIELTAAIGQICVAEGVEDAAQFAVLRDLGVHAYQGWLFARAMPGEAFTALLRRGPIEPAALAG